MRLIKEKDLPDFETGYAENLRSAVRQVMKICTTLPFCFTGTVSSNHSEEPECFNFLLNTLSSGVAPSLDWS